MTTPPRPAQHAVFTATLLALGLGVVVLLPLAARWSPRQSNPETTAAQEPRNELDLGCPAAQTTTFSHFGSQVRLMGEGVCVEKKPRRVRETASLNAAEKETAREANLETSWRLLSIANRTGGGSARVFHLPNGRFTTEYFDLQPGLNEITLEQKNRRGQRRTILLKLVSES